MKRIGIIAALSGELKPLVRGWQKRGRNLWVGRVADCEATAVAEGIGTIAAERGAERMLSEFDAEALVSYGWAGALTCAVKPPTACAISEVVDASGGGHYATKCTRGYRLITLDRVAGPNEKRGLAEKYQSVLVDMEAAAVARIAYARNVPFYCFKGISDGYNDQLPDFSRFIDGAGQLRMAPLLAHAAAHPKYWPSMQRLGKNSRASATALAGLLEECIKELS